MMPRVVPVLPGFKRENDAQSGALPSLFFGRMVRRVVPFLSRSEVRMVRKVVPFLSRSLGESGRNSAQTLSSSPEKCG